MQQIYMQSFQILFFAQNKKTIKNNAICKTKNIYNKTIKIKEYFYINNNF